MDTSEAADRAYFDLLRKKSPTERLRMAFEWSAAVEQISAAGIRLRHPHATEREVALRLAAFRLGDDLVRKAFGWDPRVKGR